MNQAITFSHVTGAALIGEYCTRIRVTQQQNINTSKLHVLYTTNYDQTGIFQFNIQYKQLLIIHYCNQRFSFTVFKYAYSLGTGNILSLYVAINCSKPLYPCAYGTKAFV